MLMKVVNIHSFILIYRAYILFLMLCMFDFPAASDYLVIKFNNKAKMLMPDIWHYFKFGRMRLFVSAFKESFNNSDVI